MWVELTAAVAAGATIVQGAGGACQCQTAGRRESAPADSGSNPACRARCNRFNNRVSAAQAELNVRIPNEVTNGDEQRFPNRIGNYSKGLVHNGIGEVYAAVLRQPSCVP